MPQLPGYLPQPNGLLGPAQPPQDPSWGAGAPVSERAAAISAEAERLQQQYAQLQQQMAALQQQQQLMHGGAGLYGGVAAAGSGLGGIDGGMLGGGGVDWSGGGGGGGGGGGQHAAFATSLAALEPPVRPHLRRTVECRHWLRGNCHRGDACNFAHSPRMPGGNAVPTAAQAASGHYGGGRAVTGGGTAAPHASVMPGQALPSTPVPFVPRRRDGPAPAINPNPSVVGGKRKYDESSAGVGMLGMARVRARYSYCAHTTPTAHTHVRTATSSSTAATLLLRAHGACAVRRACAMHRRACAICCAIMVRAPCRTARAPRVHAKRARACHMHLRPRPRRCVAIGSAGGATWARHAVRRAARLPRACSHIWHVHPRLQP